MRSHNQFPRSVRCRLIRLLLPCYPRRSEGIVGGGLWFEIVLRVSLLLLLIQIDRKYALAWKWNIRGFSCIFILCPPHIVISRSRKSEHWLQVNIANFKDDAKIISSLSENSFSERKMHKLSRHSSILSGEPSPSFSSHVYDDFIHLIWVPDSNTNFLSSAMVVPRTNHQIILRFLRMKPGEPGKGRKVKSSMFWWFEFIPWKIVICPTTNPKVVESLILCFLLSMRFLRSLKLTYANIIEVVVCFFCLRKFTGRDCGERNEFGGIKVVNAR